MEAVHEAAALIEERLESIEVTLSRTNKILEQIALVMINRYRHERYGLEEIRSLDELE